jgi:PRTRC genetic system ThiF family protein
MNKKKILFLDEYLLRELHPIVITIYGAGGTGSHLAVQLARVNFALLSMGRRGLDVTVVDSDECGSTTPVRAQLNPYAIGQLKALSLISGLNSAYGTNWKSQQQGFIPTNCDFFITCTDTVRSRREIFDSFGDKYKYFIDCGNGDASGQVIMGTSKRLSMNQKKSKFMYSVPNVFDMFPNIQDEDTRDSCSVYESIRNQGLFVNSILANLCANMIYEFLTDHALDYHGYFFNMENGWAKIPITYLKSK